MVESKRIKPRRLSRGDTIGIVSLASPVFKPSAIDEAIQNLTRMGFRVKVSASVKKADRYLAGDDDFRLREFHRMVADPEVTAIMSTRGGYGSGRLLTRIDYELISKHPKIIIGYSDITSILLAITRLTGLITFYGPMFASEFKSPVSGFTADGFEKVLVQGELPLEIGPCPNAVDPLILSPGRAQGALVGGCLTLISYSLGTPYEIDTKGKLLFFEETREPPYKIDGMITHLLNAGKLQECAGVAIGEMVDCDPDQRPGSFPSGSFHWEEVIEERLGGLGIPILAGLCFGHGEHKATLPVGGTACLDTACRRLILTESPVC